MSASFLFHFVKFKLKDSTTRLGLKDHFLLHFVNIHLQTVWPDWVGCNILQKKTECRKVAFEFGSLDRRLVRWPSGIEPSLIAKCDQIWQYFVTLAKIKDLVNFERVYLVLVNILNRLWQLFIGQLLIVVNGQIS